jgi:P-type E1-E2 ATPase
MSDSAHSKIKVRNIEIIDNLAQINLLLTDKTGTLTKNKFELVSCYTNG